MKRKGSPSQRALTSLESSGPNTGRGKGWPPLGEAGAKSISWDTGIICPMSADLSTVGGWSLGRIKGVLMAGASGMSCNCSIISPMGVMPPMGSFSKGNPMARAPTSLPSM